MLSIDYSLCIVPCVSQEEAILSRWGLNVENEINVLNLKISHGLQNCQILWFEPTFSCTAGEHSSKELLQQLMLLATAIRNLYNILLFLPRTIGEKFLDKDSLFSCEHLVRNSKC